MGWKDTIKPVENTDKKEKTTSWRDTIVKLDEQPDKLESFWRGAVQGGTFGFGDEATGAIEATADAIRGKDGGFVDNYAKHRDEARANNEKAAKANPWTYRGGNFVGGAWIPGIAGAKAATVAGSVLSGAASGAASGAVTGLGESEKESVGQAIGDAALGGVSGTVTGGVAGGVTNVIVRSLSKKGQEGLKHEFKDMVEGFRKKPKGKVLESIPGAGPLAAKAIKAIKTANEGSKVSTELRETINEAKRDIVLNLKDEGHNPAEVAASLYQMPDEEFIMRALIDDKPNKVKNWISRLASQEPGQIQQKEYESILELGTAKRNAATDFVKDKRQIAKEIAPMVSDTSEAIKTATKQRVGELTVQAANKFENPNDISVISGIKDAMKDADSLKTIPSKFKSRLEDVESIIDSGEGLSAWQLNKGQKYTEALPQEKFKRLQKARETLDLGIDWDAIKSKKRPMNEGEKILAGQRDEIDKVLKSIPEKQQADLVFQLGQDIRDTLFKKTEFKGGVDSYKLNRLFGTGEEGLRFKDKLDTLAEWANDEQYAPAAREMAQRMVKKFNTLYELNDNAKLLSSDRWKQGASSPAIERLSSRLRKQNAVDEAISSPASFISSTDEMVRNIGNVLGRKFDDMNEAEKSAFVSVLIKAKDAAREGRYPTDDTLKTWYQLFTNSK